MSMYSTTITVSIVLSLVALGIIISYVSTKSRYSHASEDSSELALWTASIGVLALFCVAAVAMAAGGGILWTLALPAFIIAVGGAVSNLAANAISGRYGGAPDEAIEWGDDFVDDGAGFYDRNGSVHNAGTENLSLAAARDLGPLS